MAIERFLTLVHDTDIIASLRLGDGPVIPLCVADTSLHSGARPRGSGVAA